MGNQELLRGVETLVMEDLVVDWVADQAKISTTKSTFDKVMNPDGK
jgi:trigger factor